MQTAKLQLIQRALGHLLRRWPTEMARDALHIVGEELIRRQEKAEHLQEGSDMESTITAAHPRGWRVSTGGLVDVVLYNADAELVGRLQGFIVEAQDRARKAEQERDAARELAEQRTREAVDMARLRRKAEHERQASDAARDALLGSYEKTSDELRDALGTISALKAELDASPALTDLETAARKVVDAHQAWFDSDELFDCKEYDAVCSAVDDLEALLPAEPGQPDSGSLNWFNCLDDENNVYLEAQSPYTADDGPICWRLRQRIRNDRIEWYTDNDPELHHADWWLSLEEAKAGIQKAHDRILREVPANTAEPEQPEPERVPQRFRWRVSSGGMAFGWVVPLPNGAWQIEEPCGARRVMQHDLPRAVSELVNSPVEWLDHDYEWSRS